MLSASPLAQLVVATIHNGLHANPAAQIEIQTKQKKMPHEFLREAFF